MTTTAEKRIERQKRRDMGYVQTQVWVHKLDMVIFKSTLDNLPHASMWQDGVAKVLPNVD